jgi:hypothetical protein
LLILADRADELLAQCQAYSAHSAANYLSPAEYEEKFKSAAWGVET